VDGGGSKPGAGAINEHAAGVPALWPAHERRGVRRQTGTPATDTVNCHAITWGLAGVDDSVSSQRNRVNTFHITKSSGGSRIRRTRSLGA